MKRGPIEQLPNPHDVQALAKYIASEPTDQLELHLPAPYACRHHCTTESRPHPPFKDQPHPVRQRTRVVTTLTALVILLLLFARWGDRPAIVAV